MKLKGASAATETFGFQSGTNSVLNARFYSPVAEFQTVMAVLEPEAISFPSGDH